MTPNREQLSDKLSAEEIAYLFSTVWEVLWDISAEVVKAAYWAQKFHPRIAHLCASKKARVRKKNARRLWRLYLKEARR